MIDDAEKLPELYGRFKLDSDLLRADLCLRLQGQIIRPEPDARPRSSKGSRGPQQAVDHITET